mmetsp:Transcript_21620/g.23150  ORF Transcript_21620/g.23150 Transcript_21620/m.23150 type:complete len:82 (-) Transcript_21620:44-289(-)
MLINRCKTLQQKEKTKTTWMENYQRLVEYQQKHDTFLVQFDLCNQDQYCFERWVDTQRNKYKYKTLSKERMDLLHFIGFPR